MVLHTYITPSNNEYKERIKETRYMSYSETLTDDIKKLMDIDIVRDLANKAMYLNDQLPYDVASITARQIYLGEPISGIEIPLIEEEEEMEMNNEGLFIENPHFKEENVSVTEELIDEPVMENIFDNEVIENKEEEIISDSFIIENEVINDIITEEEIIDNIIEDSITNDLIIDDIKDDNLIIDEIIDNKEEIVDGNINDTNLLVEDNDELEKTFDLSNMLSELPVGMLDEIPNKNMLDELPIGEEIKVEDDLNILPIGEEIKVENDLILDDNLLDSLQKENQNDLLNTLLEDTNMNLIDDSNIKEEKSNAELLVDLPELNDNMLPELADNILIEEPIKSFDNDAKEELVRFDLPNLDQTSQMLANLTNGFTMDFQDEPVMQKVKTR